MRYSVSYIIFSILLFCSSCSKNEFNLEFNLSEDITENYNVTYYASSKKGGRTVQAVASVMNGRCLLKCITNLPTLVYLTNRNSNLPLVIYAEKGNKISITGKTNNPLSWDVEGNEINSSLSKWRIENEETLTTNDPAAINKTVAEFVDENKKDPVSIILMQSYFCRGEDEMGYIDLMAKLNNVSHRKRWLKLVSRSDQYDISLAYPARIESLVMRSPYGGADTLRFDGKNAGGILIFWQNDMKGKTELVDSIKTLVKEFPDSSARVISDINLDNDSVVWKNTVKRDSLKTVVRLWAPAGLADNTVRKLKVNGIPYFIVLEKDGSQAYRGKEFSDAKREFQKVINKKDSI